MPCHEAVIPIAVARGSRHWLLVAVSFLVGCSFESNPSLGWHLQPADPILDAAPDADADVDADADANVDIDVGNPTDSSTGQENGVADAATAEPSCPAGLYAGQFTCTVGDVPFPLTLQMQFRLERLSPEFPEATANAPVFLEFAAGVMIANLVARLNCTTGVFHGDLTEGFGLVVPLIAFAFIGTIEGQIDETGTLAGTWGLESPEGAPFAAIRKCDGQWSARPARP